jgi:hydrogenase expression/formation protein HypC
MCLGVPGKVIETFVEDDVPMGTVDFGGIRRKVSLSFEPSAKVGTWVVVHVGFAITTVDEREAERSYALLAEMGNLENVDLPQDAHLVPGGAVP